GSRTGSRLIPQSIREDPGRLVQEGRCRGSVRHRLAPGEPKLLEGRLTVRFRPNADAPGGRDAIVARGKRGDIAVEPHGELGTLEVDSERVPCLSCNGCLHTILIRAGPTASSRCDAP